MKNHREDTVSHKIKYSFTSFIGCWSGVQLCSQKQFMTSMNALFSSSSLPLMCTSVTQRLPPPPLLLPPLPPAPPTNCECIDVRQMIVSAQCPHLYCVKAAVNIFLPMQDIKHTFATLYFIYISFLPALPRLPAPWSHVRTGITGTTKETPQPTTTNSSAFHQPEQCHHRVAITEAATDDVMLRYWSGFAADEQN